MFIRNPLTIKIADSNSDDNLHMQRIEVTAQTNAKRNTEVDNKFRPIVIWIMKRCQNDLVWLSAMHMGWLIDNRWARGIVSMMVVIKLTPKKIASLVIFYFMIFSSTHLVLAPNSKRSCSCNKVRTWDWSKGHIMYIKINCE